MWRRTACQTLSKALDISSATARVAPDLLKALAILSDTTVRRLAVDWEDKFCAVKKNYRYSDSKSSSIKIGVVGKIS